MNTQASDFRSSSVFEQESGLCVLGILDYNTQALFPSFKAHERVGYALG